MSDHVLLIGIDAYEAHPLRGCVNDVLAIRELLIARVGVEPGRVRVLASPQAGVMVAGAEPATAGAILGALDELAGDRVGAGDRVIIYYAGHGGSRVVEGDRGRHAVECLVPVDFSAVAAGPLIYDTELNRKLASIGQRTENVTVLLDCCYSGGVTRDRVESGAAARYLPLPRLDASSRATLGGRIDLASSARSIDEHTTSVVTIAGCLADERSLETTTADGRHGVFTRALVQTLQASGTREVTWHEVWPQLVSACRPQQTPAFLGDDRRRPFGARCDGDVGEIRVTPEGTRFRVHAGTLVDVTPGTRIAVYGASPAVLPRPGADEDAARRAMLTVVAATATEAWARPDVAIEWPRRARCRIAGYGTAVLRVRFVSPPSDAIVQALRCNASLELVDTEPCDVRLVRDGGAWVLCDDLHRTAAEGGPELVCCTDDEIAGVLARYLRYRTPLRLAARCNDLPNLLHIQLLDASRAPSDPQAPDLGEVRRHEGYRYGLHVGDPFCVVLENRSETPLRSVALLDCGSSGAVQYIAACTLPAQARHVLWAGEQLGVPFRLAGPAGVERLVAIGSTRPDLDWRFLAIDQRFRDHGRDFEPVALSREVYTATTVAVRVLAMSRA